MQTISTTPIYFTKDYKLFKFITGNRNINERKVKKIINDIDDGLNMLKYCPIVVTKEMKIIDGQHRFHVCKILKHPVFYVIAEEISLKQIANINSRTERWKPIDFVNCYMANGNTQYAIIKRFVDEYQLPVSCALMVLTNGITGNAYSLRQIKEFENGEFKVVNEAGAEKLVKYSMRFDDFPGRTTGTFLKALNYLFRAKLFNEEILIKKFLDNKEALTIQGSHKGYLIKLEEIYNYRNQKRQAIY